MSNLERVWTFIACAALVLAVGRPLNQISRQDAFLGGRVVGQAMIYYKLDVPNRLFWLDKLRAYERLGWVEDDALAQQIRNGTLE